MSREWKPGDVALRVTTEESKIALRVTAGKCHPGDAPHWHTVTRDGRADWDLEFDGVQFRPLVVIDPEDPDQVSALVIALAHQGWTPTTAHGARDALRSLVADPKPEEPTGLGAVVEIDSHLDPGSRRMLVRGHATNQPWMGDGRKWDWCEIPAAVRVLSDGVTA